MKLRWLTEHSEEYFEDSNVPKKISSEPKLQYGEEVTKFDINNDMKSYIENYW